MNLGLPTDTEEFTGFSCAVGAESSGISGIRRAQNDTGRVRIKTWWRREWDVDMYVPSQIER